VCRAQIIRSTPLRCHETFDEAVADLAPFPFPVTREEERIWVRSDRAVAQACAERAGPILDHMSTASVARDLDLLRRAVGDAKLTYAGYSYGSYLGSTYANLFPGKVRALVVDGVLDPFIWPEWAEVLQQLWELTSPEAAAASLQAVKARLGVAFQQEDYPNLIEGFPGVACSETHNPDNVRAWSRAARAGPPCASPTWCRSPSRPPPRPSRPRPRPARPS
jgi:pimeloyl-ACP methyl ester carboxylesterase